MKKRIVMAMLAAMMVVSNVTPVLAAGAPTGSVSDLDNPGAGTSLDVKKENAVYRVVVPTSLKVYLDPYELLVTDAQITSKDLAVINKSNIAVRVDATIKVSGKSGANVTIKDKEADVVETDPDAKLAYVEAEIPKTIEETTEQTGRKYYDSTFTNELSLYKGTVSGATKYYKASSSSAVGDEGNADDEMKDTTAATGDYTNSVKVPVSSSSDGTTLSFVLEESKYIPYAATYDADADKVAFQGVAEDNKSSAVFRLNGKLNTAAAWADGDIEGTVTYKFTGLSASKYLAQTVSADAHRYLAGEATTANEAPTFTSTTAGVIDYTPGAGDSGLGTITAINVTVSSTTYNLLNANGNFWQAATIDDGNYTITLGSNATASLANFASGGKIAAKIVYTDGAGNENQEKPVDIQIQ